MSVRNFLRYHFGIPRDCNWSYPIFMMSIGLAVFYAVKCILTREDSSFDLTSLVGYASVIPLMTIICLVLPSVTLSRKFTSEAIGSFTGSGILLLSFFSGIPLMLIDSSLHNVLSWLWLRLGQGMIYPVFFYYGDTQDAAGTVLGILTDTIIPGIGVSLFFFGLMWSRFRTADRTVGYIIIALCYALYSLNFIDFTGLLITGLWLVFIRGKAGNVIAPFACLIGARLSEFLFSDTLTRVDILTVQTYSDIGTAFFYTSLPALFVGIVLISFFMRGFNDFGISYDNCVIDSDFDRKVPSFDRGLNPALILAVIILITLWIMVIKGVHV